MTIARRGDRAHYSGLQKCGSVWACPVCSAKIQAERGDELVAAVAAAQAQGLDVALITLTMQHNVLQQLQPMWDALSDAFAAAMSTDRRVRAEKRRLGVVGWIRRVEATYGSNGWHLHAHVLLFLERSDQSLDALSDAMFGGWVRRLVRHGFDARREHGIDMKRLDLGEAGAEVARYLTKTTYERAGRELAGQHGKVAKSGNRTPFDVLADLVRDDTHADRVVWHEWEQASHGRRALTWSKGIRDRLGLDGELDDQAVVDSNDQEQVDVAVLSKETWKAVVERGLEAVLLDVVEAVPLDQALATLSRFMHGVGLDPPWEPVP